MVGNMAAFRERAVNLLEEVTRLIREHTSKEPENGSPRNDAEADAVSGRETNGRVLENFRNLFQPYTARERSTSFSSSSKQQSASASASSAPATKRRKRNTTVVFFKRDTWIHEFFCLANKEQIAVPSRSLKNQLQQAGLGRKKICFHSKANVTEVKTKLEESYPKLIAGGGFEILRRCPSSSELSVIPPPNSGYTVHFLRDCAGLGQAIAYVRPVRVGQGFCVFGIQGRFKSGIRYIAA